MDQKLHRGDDTETIQPFLERKEYIRLRGLYAANCSILQFHSQRSVFQMQHTLVEGTFIPETPDQSS